MLSKLTGWDDTIVALATPPGIGALGVIRISGKNAIPIINKLFPSKDLTKAESHTLHVGILKDGDENLDEAVISVFKNPRSYTGEDVIEISCHGSPYVQQQVIDAIIRNGARLAKAGEFTQRAFLNGKLDLAQAEAVADLIASNTEASKKAALQTMRGGFSGILKELREQLIQFSSLIELELDFSEEDVEFADRTKFIELIHKISSSTQKLLDSFRLGNVIKNGVSVAIVGKPNAGKSTLLNQLLNEDRAIVSDIAGTTRDTIEEVLNIEGILFRLMDTAGIREHTHDIIENMGVMRSLEKMKDADIVLYVFDVNDMTDEELKIISDQFIQDKKDFILAGNKADALVDVGEGAKVSGHLQGVRHLHGNPELVLISAKENTGIDKLKATLFTKAISSGNLTENIVVTNARHYEALQHVQSSLKDILLGLETKITGDLLALDIRQCLHYLGEITGEITNDDRLDFIFSKFCIGK